MKKIVKKWIESDKEEIISFLTELVSCHNAEDIEDTRKPFELVTRFLDKEGLDFQEITHTDKMPNLLTSIQGSKDGKHLMLNGHLDVLPVGDNKNWKDIPFSGRIYDGKIFGRGVTDMKAGVVAMLYAYRYVNRMKESLAGKLSLSIVSDEETGWGRGTGYLFKKVPEKMLCDGVLLAEPTHREGIAISSKGYTQFVIQIQSSGAISGYDNLTINPMMLAMDLIREIKKLEGLTIDLPLEIQNLFQNRESQVWYEERFGHRMYDQLSKVTFDITEFHTGDGAMMIPSMVNFTVMIVSPVGVNRNNILARVRRIVKKYPHTTMKVLGGDDGDYCTPKTTLFSYLNSAITEVLDVSVKPVAEIAISDARYWRYAGIPAYWYGLNGETVGMPNEFVVIEDLLSLIEIYTQTILTYLS